MRARILPVLLLLGSTSCGSSAVEDLQGHWTGPITCFGGVSDLSLTILIDKTIIAGDGQIRTNDSNQNYKISGAQTTVSKLGECAGGTECTVNADCAEALDKDGKKGNSKCNMGLCDPCFQHTDTREVRLTLQHENVQIPYPELVLLRFGSDRMTGTINKFCPDPNRPTPNSVKLDKQ
jgi:hypothetical protein